MSVRTKCPHAPVGAPKVRALGCASLIPHETMREQKDQ